MIYIGEQQPFRRGLPGAKVAALEPVPFKVGENPVEPEISDFGLEFFLFTISSARSPAGEQSSTTMSCSLFLISRGSIIDLLELPDQYALVHVKRQNYG